MKLYFVFCIFRTYIRTLLFLIVLITILAYMWKLRKGKMITSSEEEITVFPIES